MYLNCEELAEILRVNPETVRRKTRSGEIPHLRLGDSIRYVMADVEQAMRVAYQTEPKNAAEYFQQAMQKLTHDFWDEQERVAQVWALTESRDRALESGHLSKVDYYRLVSESEDFYATCCERKRPVAERLAHE